MHVNSRYALPAEVRFRREDFGGVVYRRQDDRLFFLNSSLAVILLGMAGRGTVREIAADLEKAGAGNQSSIEPIVLKILASLEELGIVYELAGS